MAVGIFSTISRVEEVSGKMTVESHILAGLHFQPPANSPEWSRCWGRGQAGLGRNEQGIDSVREVTEKLVRDFVPLWARVQNGAIREHWGREQILRIAWREFELWRSQDLNRVIQQIR